MKNKQSINRLRRTTEVRPSAAQPAGPQHWRLRAGAVAVLAGISLMASTQIHAADASGAAVSVSELQQEVARLRQQLQDAQRERDLLKNGGTNGIAQVPDGKAAANGGSEAKAASSVNYAGKELADTSVQTLDQIVVHSRDRVEKLLEVPIPVSAISQKTLEQYNANTIQDYANLTPNLLVHASNGRQQSIFIRGLGKNTSGNAMANDSLEPSVGVIIDGVPSAYITQAWGDFADLDHVEILRGPQGTLLGKNTTIGVVNVVTKAPSFTPSSTIELSSGLDSHGALGGKFSVTGPIQDGVLAYRASLSISDNPGPFTDIAALHNNTTYQEKKRIGARLQFLLLPTDSVTARFTVDRQESSELTLFGEPPLISDPVTFPDGSVRPTTYTSRLARSYFGGYKPLIGNWNVVDNNGSQPYRNSSNGLSAKIDWALHGSLEGFTLTSITAYRDSLFDAKNDSDWTKFDIGQGGAVSTQKQISQELRISSPVGKDKPLDYTAGLYLLKSKVNSLSRSLYGADGGAFYATNAQYASLTATPVGRLLLTDSLRGLYVTSYSLPETSSKAIFGQANWHYTDKATLTFGLRQTMETRDNAYAKQLVTDSPLLANIAKGIYTGATAAELNAAKAVRTAQISSLGYGAADTLKATSYGWLINPSYQLNEDVLLYTSVGKGEKSGAAQVDTTTFKPFKVAPEKVLDLELGFKGTFFDRSVILSGNLYDSQVTDYQQGLTVLDPVQTAATGVTSYTSYMGNAKGVVLRGLELDGSWTPNNDSNWRFTFGGAYNHAYYSDFKNAPCPQDISGEPNGAQQCDNTGKQLPFAPKYSGNYGIDYHHPIINANFVGHAFVNNTYRSSANYSASLSSYGEQKSYYLTDGGVGISTRDGKWDISLVGRNIFDTHYVTNIGLYGTSSAITATPGPRKYWTLTLRANQF